MADKKECVCDAVRQCGPSPEQRKEIYRALSAPFPDEAIERTYAAQTRKGYDTTGIKYQYCVNRLNEVLGVGGFRTERAFRTRESQSRSGQTMYDVVCDVRVWLGVWDNGSFVPFAEAQGTGGHKSGSEADAEKGAYTNGFKKCVAMYGVGRQAYEGTLDDDNVPADGTTLAQQQKQDPHQDQQKHGRYKVVKIISDENPKEPDPQKSDEPSTYDKIVHYAMDFGSQKMREIIERHGGKDHKLVRDDPPELQAAILDHCEKYAKVMAAKLGTDKKG